MSNVDFKAVEHDRQVTLQTLVHGGTDAPRESIRSSQRFTMYISYISHGHGKYIRADRGRKIKLPRGDFPFEKLEPFDPTSN